MRLPEQIQITICVVDCWGTVMGIYQGQRVILSPHVLAQYRVWDTWIAQPILSYPAADGFCGTGDYFRDFGDTWKAAIYALPIRRCKIEVGQQIHNADRI
jgi:hypothetical protein